MLLRPTTLLRQLKKLKIRMVATMKLTRHLAPATIVVATAASLMPALSRPSKKRQRQQHQQRSSKLRQKHLQSLLRPLQNSLLRRLQSRRQKAALSKQRSAAMTTLPSALAVRAAVRLDAHLTTRAIS
jgi:signal recognition particle GTPase